MSKALLDAMWQTMSRAGGSLLQHCLAWQLEGPGRVFVNQLIAWPGIKDGEISGEVIDPYGFKHCLRRYLTLRMIVHCTYIVP